MYDRHDRFRERHRERHYAEEYAYILDYLPQGNPLDKHPAHRSKPFAQAIGDSFFTLLELHPKPGKQLEIGERVYIGKGFREKIARVFGRVEYEDLTGVAKSNLPGIVRLIVESKEPVFVEFFNLAGPLTLKLHVLELLPGIGKKTLKILLEERQRRPFDNFEDIRERAKKHGVTLPDPVDMLVDRIISELKGEEKYYLFAKPPPGRHAMYFGFLEKLYRRLGIEIA